MEPTRLTDANHQYLVDLQRDTMQYFFKEANPRNGMVPDNTRRGAHCSITAVGFALACYAVAAARGLALRKDAAQRTLTTLHFLWQAPQGEDADATGYRGFFYHFLDMQHGRRAWKSELSTIDTTFLLAGALLAACFFDGGSPEEQDIRDLADALFQRADWQWATDGALLVSHGWRPESGFLPHRWEGYAEALLLYVLALGSPTFPLPAASYADWTRTYKWKKIYGHEFLYAGPLFIHQFSHVWIDFRGIQDEFMRARGSDYFENSRRATLVQREYARRNPRGFTGYGADCWGVTASDGPGPARRFIDGKEQTFWDYRARGVPWGPDDGTLAPWAVIASLPFAPGPVIQAIGTIEDRYPGMSSEYGFKCSFNPTFPAGSGRHRDGPGWTSRGYYGLDQGPVVLMIENFLSGLPWSLMRHCSWLRSGLDRAGFRGGWLST